MLDTYKTYAANERIHSGSQTHLYFVMRNILECEDVMDFRGVR
jgi:hypothetical protein